MKEHYQSIIISDVHLGTKKLPGSRSCQISEILHLQ